MKLTAPDYFNDFKCIAGACRHSCCVGWEIDIDPVSYMNYMNMQGEFGDRIREHIGLADTGPYFRMTEDCRCPFLNEEGLCDMIIALGEDSLCQICDDHPRFRNFFSDREEIGLGLCCEAAGRLILGRKEPVKLITMEAEDKSGEEDEEELELLDIRGELITAMQDRSAPMTERVASLMYDLGMRGDIDYVRWAEALKGLERLDERWTDELDALIEGSEEADLDEWDTEFEQLMVYLLYRHIPAALEDGDIDVHAAFCCVMWLIIRRMCARKEELTFEDIVEICRLYSSEIEYSDENIGAILAQLDI